MADATEQVVGMVPLVFAVGILNKTSESAFGNSKPKKKRTMKGLSLFKKK